MHIVVRCPVPRRMEEFRDAQTWMPFAIVNGFRGVWDKGRGCNVHFFGHDAGSELVLLTNYTANGVWICVRFNTVHDNTTDRYHPVPARAV